MSKSTFNTVLRAYADANRQKAIAERQRDRLASQAQVAAERERRSEERLRAADQKEERRLYSESRAAEVAEDTEEIAAVVAELQGILQVTLDVDDFLDFETLKDGFKPPPFEPGALGVPEPEPSFSVPPFDPPPPPEFPELSRGQSMLPGRKAKHEREIEDMRVQHDQAVLAAKEGYESAVARARADHDVALSDWREREADRGMRLEEAKGEHDSLVRMLADDAQAENQRIEQLRTDFDAGRGEAIRSYFAMVLQASAYSDAFPRAFEVGYLSESMRLVIDKEVPLPSVIPEVKGYKYVKTRDERTPQPRSATEVKGIYSSILAQLALRTVHEVLEADRSGKLQAVAFNGYVTSPDPATGKPRRTYLVSLDVDREAFLALELASVDPVACVKSVGKLSSKPQDLEPVPTAMTTEEMISDEVESSSSGAS